MVVHSATGKINSHHIALKQQRTIYCGIDMEADSELLVKQKKYSL